MFNIILGTEPYPPNTTLPNLLPAAIILEDSWELFPCFKNSPAEDKLAVTLAHLKSIQFLSRNETVHRKNFARLSIDLQVTEDLILDDIFRTEVHLIILWGLMYADTSLEARCKQYDALFSVK